MAPKNNTDRVNELKETAATLLERCDNLDRAIQRIDKASSELDHRIRDLEKLSIGHTHRLEAIEQRTNDRGTKRWDIVKIIVTAVLIAAITLGIQAIKH